MAMCSEGGVCTGRSEAKNCPAEAPPTQKDATTDTDRTSTDQSKTQFRRHFNWQEQHRANDSKKTNYDEGISYPSSQLPLPLDSVVEAYNQASGDSFYSETTPPLIAWMELRDGTVFWLQFSPLFSQDHLLVGSAPGDDEEATFYKVKAPGLPKAVWELTGDHLDRQMYDQNMDWLPN